MVFDSRFNSQYYNIPALTNFFLQYLLLSIKKKLIKISSIVYHKLWY